METKPRRTHGTGSLYPVVGSGGRETWYGRWYVGRKHLQRRIGPKRGRSDRAGLTKAEAEAELRRMRLATEDAPPPETAVTVDEAAEHLMRHLEAIGRRPTTLATHRSLFKTHIQRRMENAPLERITRRDVEDLDRVMRRKELAPKTRLNALKLLSGTHRPSTERAIGARVAGHRLCHRKNPGAAQQCARSLGPTEVAPQRALSANGATGRGRSSPPSWPVSIPGS